MFSLPKFRGCCVSVQRLFVMIATIISNAPMFLGRTQPFKWIKRHFFCLSHQSEDKNPPNSTPIGSLEDIEVDGTVARTSLTVLTVNKPKTGAMPAPATNLSTSPDNNEANGDGNVAAQAPMACEEMEDDGECSLSGDGNMEKAAEADEKVVRRSKSRVCKYWKRCRDRWTGQSQPHQQHNRREPEPPASTVFQTACEVAPDAARPRTTAVTWTIVEEKAASRAMMANSISDVSVEIHANNTAVDPKDDTQQLLPIVRAQEKLSLASQTEESGIAALIDSHLSSVYPVYAEFTRAILIRQARDLLVCSFNGCLQDFEQKFLRKFAEIATGLRRKHAIGDSLLWREGWPLATPTGAIVLHLRCPDDAVLRPADIYLCVKSVHSIYSASTAIADPQLCAIWRPAAAHSEANVRTQCIDYESPQAYLSALALEMLSDELPQLLQNLLVGVEHSFDRISLNELQLPAVTVAQLADSANNNGNGAPQSITGSPKCALRRSELITKGNSTPYHHHKYMLRRLSNRQDSMKSTSSGNSCSSSGSTTSSGDELLQCGNKSAQSPNQPNEAPSASTSPVLPLFCLGNSFPHIDSDEDSDEKRHALNADPLESEIKTPASINDIPEKLLISGIYLPGTRDLKGRPLLTVDAELVAASGLNCYEIATVLLFYNTISESHASINRNGNGDKTQQTSTQQPHQANSSAAAESTFTILIAIERAEQLCVVDLICQSLKLLTRQFAVCEIHAVCLNQQILQLHMNDAAALTASGSSSNSWQTANEQRQQPQPPAQHFVKFISVADVAASVVGSAVQLPHGKLQGNHHHDAHKWREFFIQLEPFQRLCAAVGQRLVAAMSDIRSADLQGIPTRRQLYAQHRALSRALMDSELHNLRKRGKMTLTRLQDLGKALNGAAQTANNNGDSSSSSGSANGVDNVNSSSQSASACNIDVAVKLQKLTLLFGEVDRAAQRLEQLTEQRRERLRELTRQRALEEEINGVTTWITNDGNETLQRYSVLPLECRTAIKQHEQEFEKYYFISMKHLAKGRDLHEAATHFEALHESAINLKTALDCFAEKLERARERIEGAARLHHLLCMHEVQEAGAQQEIQRLAEQVGLTELLDKYRLQQQQQQQQQRQQHDTHPAGMQQLELETAVATEQMPLVARLEKPTSLNLKSTTSEPRPQAAQLLRSSTPNAAKASRATAAQHSHSHRSSSGIGSLDGGPCRCWRASRNLEDTAESLHASDEEEYGEEQQSKVADSGVGGCDRCEGNPKLTRVCSCQSLNEPGNLYDKSDELDDEGFERPSKQYLDMRSPMEANAHLQCHASNLELPTLEELSSLDPKIQKTLLLIMREMIGTERDYVRSLYYVIENYVDELLRDDIPQPLRGQRNVIFGNIEKIFEFHNAHFLTELERYEHNPLKVGAAFLEMESKFYLYALYNKNKPKSDTLLSEYGTAFFKSKQIELNDKMDLASYLLKPVQRMGKYALLLQQLVKACNSSQSAALQEIAADVEELQRAEEMVKFQLRHGNDLLAMDSLRDCDVNVKEQGRLLRQNEFLVWQGRGGKKTLRQAFLFEELVLFSKARRFPDHKNLDIYIYKNSIKTSDIGLTARIGDSTTKFEIWFRKRKPEDTWTLQCMSEDIKNAWTEEISKLLWKQAKRNREIRLAEMSSMGIGSKPCLDIRPSNNQISDRSVTISQLGKAAPKLRYSFVGLHSELDKGGARRPNSFSESSLSSGTSSSSSLSTASSSGHERLGNPNRSPAVLELINETQTLKLSSHKRSKTLVSQLSMESGILSDISVTPDQEHVDLTATWSGTGVIMRRPKLHKSAHLYSSDVPAKCLEDDGDDSNPYFKDKEEMINL